MRSMPSIILIACVYAAAIFIAEITLGSAADFSLHVWYFTAVPAWQWSAPVHAAGFLWIASWSRALRARPAIHSIAVSWAYFLAAETSNRCRLKLFEYSAEPLGVNASFIAVLVLYAILCSAVVYGLRVFVLRK